MLDMFTKVLSKLMSESDKPEDAIRFIRANIGDTLNDQDTIESLTQKLNEANQVIEELRAKLSQYEDNEVSVAVAPETTTITTPVASPAAAAIVPEETSASAPDSSSEPMQVEETVTPKETAVAVEEVTKVADAPAVSPPAPAVSPPAAPESEKVVEKVAEPAAKTEEKGGNSEAPVPVAEPEKPKEAVEVAAVAPVATESAEAPKPDEKMET